MLDHLTFRLLALEPPIRPLGEPSIFKRVLARVELGLIVLNHVPESDSIVEVLFQHENRHPERVAVDHLVNYLLPSNNLGPTHP